MYDQIATYYHLTHQQLKTDIPFLLEQAEKTGGPILELGCGTGRVLLPIGRAGHTIVGLDSSKEMLAIARQQLRQSPTHAVSLHEGDMTNFTLAPSFGLCIISYNTIMHLNNQALTSCLGHVHAALKPQGKLLIDTINPHHLAELENQPEFELEEKLKIPESGEELGVYGRYQQTASQQLSLTWRFVTTVEQVEASAVYHYRYPHQLQLALQHAGFTIDQLMGDYDSSPFSEDAPRCIILAQKHTQGPSA